MRPAATRLTLVSKCVRFIHIRIFYEFFRMARVQLIMPDKDRDRFVHQARREGMTLSAWLRAAAHQRLGSQQESRLFRNAGDLQAFFRQCDELEGPEKEPDWDQHLRVIEQSRGRGSSGT